MKDVQAIVTAAYRLSDENDRLREEMRWMRRAQSGQTQSEDEALRQRIYEHGRRQIFEHCWRDSWVDLVDGRPKPFPDWSAGAFIYDMPDFMSRDQFMREYEGEIRDVYDKAVEKETGRAAREAEDAGE